MPHTKVLFLCNPGNPTGTRIANSEIVRLRERLSPNVLLVVDQAYGEFDGQDPSPIFDLVGRGDTVVLRTFSKAYGLAGARVGWGLFPEEIAASVRKLLNPNNVSSCSQAMAAAALRDQDHMLGLVRKTEIIRDEALRRLRGAGYPVPQSHTNFLLVPFETPERAAEADELLRRESFILRGVGGYGLPRCLRATVVEEVAMRRVADIICALQEGGNAK